MVAETENSPAVTILRPLRLQPIAAPATGVDGSVKVVCVILVVYAFKRRFGAHVIVGALADCVRVQPCNVAIWIVYALGLVAFGMTTSTPDCVSAGIT